MNNEIPLISIAMTTYNGEKFLEQQIDSILKQSWKNIELIICDDQSVDSTVQIIERYMKKYDSIKLYKNSNKLGIVKNFEKAISLCQASYIALSDQDDIWIKNKLEVLMQEMRELEKFDRTVPLMVHSDLTIIDEKNQVIHKSFSKMRGYDLKNTKDLNHIISRCGVMGNTLLMNKHLQNTILPFPDALDMHDYWISVVNELYGKRITLKESLVLYRIHEDNFSNSIEKMQKYKLKKVKLFFTFNFALPYMDLNREKVLEPLLLSSNVAENDKYIMNHFLRYLNFNASKIKLFNILTKYHFVKKDFLYRIKLFMTILFTQKYK